jgi:hypothetical protein
MKNTRLMALCVAILTVIIAALGLFTPRTVLAQQVDTGSNWTGYYWDNQTFNGNPKVTRIDPSVNFNWGEGSPDPSIPVNNFSVRWYNKINFTAGTFRFRAGADDGIRVAFDGQIILNRFSDAVGGFIVQTADVVVGTGTHEIIVDYYENAGAAGVLFEWTSLTGGTSSTAGNPTPVPTVANAVTNNTIVNVPVSTVLAVVIVDIANVRGGPSTDYTPIAEVYLDEQYSVVANNGANTWFLIQLKDGRRGWIFRRMIYLYNGDWTKIPVSQEAVQPQAPIVDVQGEAMYLLMVRNGPSLRNSDKIGTVNQGQSFKILKLSKNKAWVFIDADGFQGWVFLPNVKVVSGSLGRLPVGN